MQGIFWLFSFQSIFTIQIVTSKTSDFDYNLAWCLQTLKFKVLKRDIDTTLIFTCLSIYIHLLCHLCSCMTVICCIWKLPISIKYDISDGAQNHGWWKLEYMPISEINFLLFKSFQLLSVPHCTASCCQYPLKEV